jgi:hypothetical protein
MRSIAILIATIAVGLVAIGCGSSDSSSTAKTATTSTVPSGHLGATRATPQKGFYDGTDSTGQKYRFAYNSNGVVGFSINGTYLPTGGGFSGLDTFNTPGSVQSFSGTWTDNYHVTMTTSGKYGSHTVAMTHFLHK